jgi:HSP20 family protein
MPAMRRTPNWVFGDDFFKPLTGMAPMRAGIRETDTSYLFDAELPGFEPEEINVSVHDGVLTIAAEQTTNSDDQSAYTARSVRRSFTLNGINEDAIAAEYRNGVLHVTLPKENAPEAKAARRIAIGHNEKALPEQ